MGEEKRYEIVLRDLESLLQKRLGPETRLLNYETSPFTKVGDNYGSTMLKVQATIKKSADAEPTEIHLVAKMMPPTDIQRKIFQSLFTFKKEIFVYDELVPKYEEVFGEPLDIVPAVFGSRLSLMVDNEEEIVDDDAVILMENMKLKGYYMADRFQGLDMEHMRAAITSLAKFHAIGIAIKHKAPEFLPRIEKFSKTMMTGLDEIKHVIHMMLTAVEQDPEISRFYSRIRASGDPDELKNYYTQLAVDHPWACVVHADFWLNNALMHKDADDGKVDDCKLVDFQTYYTSSPLTDLVFLLCTSLRVPHDGIDELIEAYRDEAVRVLTRLDCPEALELFATDKFDERLRLDAASELFHLMEMSKIVESREGEVYEETPPNEHCMKRVRSIVDVYVRKQWI